jgi:hypothetical protein
VKRWLRWMVDLTLNLDVEVGFVVVSHDFTAIDGVDDILWNYEFFCGSSTRGESVVKNKNKKPERVFALLERELGVFFFFFFFFECDVNILKKKKKE